MRHSITGRLIAKDLHRARWLIVGALIAGVLSLVVSGFGTADGVETGFNIGVLLFMTTVIAYGIFIVMLGILKERQDRSQLFVLSLPVSVAQYSAAKVWAALIAFLVPWLVLTAGVIVATILSDRPNGGLPFFVLTMTFFLANFCLLTAVIVITMSEFWAIAGILVTNVSVTVFLAYVSRLPDVAGHGREVVATWSPTLQILMGAMSAVIVLSLGLAFLIPSRGKDFL